MSFRRIRDNQMVSESEACDANGTVKDGYAASFGYSQMLKPGERISFDMAFMDSAPRSTILTDADRSAAVARAQMIHRLGNAYLGDRAPAFTDTLAALAVQQAETDAVRVRDNLAASAAGADRARAACDAAHAKMVADLNSWRG